MKHVIWYPVKVFGFEAHPGTRTEPYKKSSCCSGRRKRQRGRSKLRWEDGVMEDARKLGGEKLEECCKE